MSIVLIEQFDLTHRFVWRKIVLHEFYWREPWEREDWLQTRTRSSTKHRACVCHRVPQLNKTSVAFNQSRATWDRILTSTAAWLAVWITEHWHTHPPMYPQQLCNRTFAGIERERCLYKHSSRMNNEQSAKLNFYLLLLFSDHQSKV